MRAREKAKARAEKAKALIPGMILVARDKETLVGRVAVAISKLARLSRASPLFRRKCCPFPRGHQFLEHARRTATFTRKFRATLSRLTCPREPVKRYLNSCARARAALGPSSVFPPTALTSFPI